MGFLSRDVAGQRWILALQHEHRLRRSDQRRVRSLVFIPITRQNRNALPI
jgi:hypothetical protein